MEDAILYAFSVTDTTVQSGSVELIGSANF